MKRALVVLFGIILSTSIARGEIRHFSVGLEPGMYEIFENGSPIDTVSVGDSTFVELPEGGQWVHDFVLSFKASGPGRFAIFPLGSIPPPNPASFTVYSNEDARAGTLHYWIAPDSWSPTANAGNIVALGSLPFIPGVPVELPRIAGWRRYVLWWFYQTSGGEWTYDFEVRRRLN